MQDEQLEELIFLCEEYEYWNDQQSEFDVYGDNAFEGE